MASSPLAAAVALAAEHAAEAERRRRLPGVVSDAIRDAGVYRMLVPASLGGGEAEIGEMLTALEELGAADGAAGWCAMVGATAGLALAHLEPEAAARVFASPATVVAGVFAPKGKADRDGEDLVVSGRWPFGSNVENADWMLGGCLLEGGPAPQLVFMPRDAIEVIDTWKVAGLCGTGSHDFAAAGLRVPAALAADPSSPPRHGGPLYAFPLFGTLALGIAAVAIGIAAAAVAETVDLAAKRVPGGSRRSLAERETVQAAIAQASAEVRAARALLHSEARVAWEEARAGEPLPLRRRAALRLAATHGVAASVRAVDGVFRHAGAGAIYDTSSLQRRLRDVHVAGQHMMVAPPTWELAGRVELGLDAEGRGI